METFSKKVNGLNTLFIKSKCNNCFIEKDIKKSNYTTSIKKQGYYLCAKCALEKRNKNNTHFKGTPIHNSYAAAKQRCNYKKGLFYHRYGGRGISIEWKNFNDFYNDMNSTWFFIFSHFPLTPFLIQSFFCFGSCKRLLIVNIFSFKTFLKSYLLAVTNSSHIIIIIFSIFAKITSILYIN